MLQTGLLEQSPEGNMKNCLTIFDLESEHRTSHILLKTSPQIPSINWSSHVFCFLEIKVWILKC